MINMKQLVIAMCICVSVIGCGKEKDTENKVVRIDKPEISSQDIVQLKNSHMAKAQDHITNKMYENAIIELNEIIRLDSKDPAAYYILGNVYDLMGKNVESVKAYMTAIKLDPYTTKQMHSSTVGSVSGSNLTEPPLATNTTVRGTASTGSSQR